MASTDSFDLRILDALQRDSARTNADIGEKIGLSPSQVSRRRARLEEEGIIGLLDRSEPDAQMQSSKRGIRCSKGAFCGWKIFAERKISICSRLRP